MRATQASSKFKLSGSHKSPDINHHRASGDATGPACPVSQKLSCTLVVLYPRSAGGYRFRSTVAALFFASKKDFTSCSSSVSKSLMLFLSSLNTSNLNDA